MKIKNILLPIGCAIGTITPVISLSSCKNSLFKDTWDREAAIENVVDRYDGDKDITAEQATDIYFDVLSKNPGLLVQDLKWYIWVNNKYDGFDDHYNGISEFNVTKIDKTNHRLSFQFTYGWNWTKTDPDQTKIWTYQTFELNNVHFKVDIQEDSENGKLILLQAIFEDSNDWSAAFIQDEKEHWMHTIMKNVFDCKQDKYLFESTMSWDLDYFTNLKA